VAVGDKVFAALVVHLTGRPNAFAALNKSK
jgi:hypothetical protein